MIVLGIETTCDETAIGIVENGCNILSNVISSQVDLHKKYGGVFPELAARQHVDVIVPTIQEALSLAGLSFEHIDLIAVAKGPGLIGSLLIGINAAKSLSLAWKKPFVGVNHVEAHLYAAMMSHNSFVFPSLGLVVSGGHTFMARIIAVGKYEMIGTTVDDAVGEAFDKVAALLDLPYPGGPEIEALALHGDPKSYSFRSGVVKGYPWDFSFSGLKTNVLYAIKGQNSTKNSPSKILESQKTHIAASFQEAALGDIAKKTLLATKEFNCQAIYVGGGVSQNKRLRALLQKKDLPAYFPKADLCIDNGAMIAGLGYHSFKKGAASFDLEPLTRIPLAKVEI